MYGQAEKENLERQGRRHARTRKESRPAAVTGPVEWSGMGRIQQQMSLSLSFIEGATWGLSTGEDEGEGEGEGDGEGQTRRGSQRRREREREQHTGPFDAGATFQVRPRHGVDDDGSAVCRRRVVFFVLIAGGVDRAQGVDDLNKQTCGPQPNAVEISGRPVIRCGQVLALVAVLCLGMFVFVFVFVSCREEGARRGQMGWFLWHEQKKRCDDGVCEQDFACKLELFGGESWGRG